METNAIEMNDEIEKIKQLFNVEPPCPKETLTIEVINSNGHISLIKKEDGTFCLRNENTGQENGRYYNEQDAIDVYTEMIREDNKV